MQDLLVTPETFFRNEVRQASSHLKVVLPDHIETYLVHLMCFFIQPPQSDDSGQENVYNLPLAELFKRAIESMEEDKRIYFLKTLGDVSLYVSGFFQDSFNRKIYDIAYYMDMGSNAYASVADLIGQKNKSIHVYRRLAKDFPRLVEIVAQVYDRTQVMQGRQDKNILAVYERWLKSNSERLEKILRENGIDPLNTNQKWAV